MIVCETPREREERLSIRDELNQKMKKLDKLEYIDEFTTVPDTRTTKQILSRVPKCCMPGWKPKDKKNDQKK